MPWRVRLPRHCPLRVRLSHHWRWRVKLAAPLVVGRPKLGRLNVGNGLYGDDPREFLARLASNIGLDKFRAVIEIKIK